MPFKFTCFFLFLIIAFKNSYSQQKRAIIIDNSKLIGKEYPTFIAFNGIDTVTNKSLEGKVALINFWFEACEPCMVEMNSLNLLFDSLKSYSDFRLISFTWDNESDRKNVQDKYGLKFDVIPLSRDECQRLNFNNGYPTSIILDKSGKITYIHSGGSTNEDAAKQFVLTKLLIQIKGQL